VRPGEASTAAAQAFRDQLAAAQRRNERPRGSAHAPGGWPQIDALPSATDVSVDELFPPAPPRQSQGLAALFKRRARPEASGWVSPRPRARRTSRRRLEQPTGAFDFLQLARAARADGAHRARPSTLTPRGQAAGQSAIRARGPAARDAAVGWPRTVCGRLADVVAADALVGCCRSRRRRPARARACALARRIPIHRCDTAPASSLSSPGRGGQDPLRGAVAAAYARQQRPARRRRHAPRADDGAELTRLCPLRHELHAVTSGARARARVAASAARRSSSSTPGRQPPQPVSPGARADCGRLPPTRSISPSPRRSGRRRPRARRRRAHTRGPRARPQRTPTRPSSSEPCRLAIDAAFRSPTSRAARPSTQGCVRAASELARCLMS